MQNKEENLVTLPHNNTLASAITNDKIRYQKKGVSGLLVALFLFLLNAYGFPTVLKHYWKHILTLGSIPQIYVIGIFLNHHIVLILYHALF